MIRVSRIAIHDLQRDESPDEPMIVFEPSGLDPPLTVLEPVHAMVVVVDGVDDEFGGAFDERRGQAPDTPQQESRNQPSTTRRAKPPKRIS